jgi:hypothetical protein
MYNDLSELPRADEQLHIVDNYREAAGIMAARCTPLSSRRACASRLGRQHSLMRQTD